MCQVIRNPDEDIDSLMYRFKRKVYNERVLEDLKVHSIFESKRDKRKRKKRTLLKAISIERKRERLQMKMMMENNDPELIVNMPV